MQLNASTLLVFLEKLVNDRLVDHIKKYGLFIDFWYWFIRSFQSTENFWQSYGIWIWHAKSFGFSGEVFGHILSFHSNRWLQMVQDGKSSQEYMVNYRVPQGSILDPALFQLYINDLPDDTISNICNIVIFAEDITFYYNYDQVSDLCQQIKFCFNWDSLLCKAEEPQ